VSCRSKAMHALGECDCFFKPRDFLELLERASANGSRCSMRSATCAGSALHPRKAPRDKP
jgi:hypothetical protein